MIKTGSGSRMRSTVSYTGLQATEKSKGVLNKAVDFCSAKKAHLRIDTHKDNKIMQHQIEKTDLKMRYY